MPQVVTVIPPAVLPVTVDDLTAFARIDDAAGEEALIESFLAAATEAAESYTRRSFITRTLLLWLDATGYREDWTPGYYELPVNYFDGTLPRAHELPLGPVIAISAVTTYDSANADTVYADSRYGLFGDRFVLNSGETWPSGLRSNHAAGIEYTTGFGSAPSDVPMPIRLAIQTHAALLFDTRGGCGCDLPAVCKQMLQPYRVETL